jgi:hypothetical protein
MTITLADINLYATAWDGVTGIPYTTTTTTNTTSTSIVVTTNNVDIT